MGDVNDDGDGESDDQEEVFSGSASGSGSGEDLKTVIIEGTTTTRPTDNTEQTTVTYNVNILGINDPGRGNAGTYLSSSILLLTATFLVQEIL